MDFIHENIVTPVIEHCDVLVAGGGISGIAAALSAARCGANTILLDRGYMLGGLATAGLVTIYLPLCDGHGRQVSFGIAEELLRLSISMGAEADYPDAWITADHAEKRKTQRFMVRYNAQSFALLAEELLSKAGVKIYYGAQVCGVHRNGNRIEAISIESKSGRQAISASRWIDATGDADLFYMAGAPTRNFQQGNILAAWYYHIANGSYTLQPRGAADVPDSRRNELQTPELLCPKRFTALSMEELSEMTLRAHECILKELRQSGRTPATIATIPQVRMTRCIIGAYTLDDTENNVHFEDGIGEIADWRRRGYVYSVPFRTMYGSEISNMLAVGRCISVTDAMWDISRVIPACAVTGEAAGAAAAMTYDFHRINISELQNTLAHMRARAYN